MLCSLRPLNYEWKPSQSSTVCVEPPSMFPVTLSLSGVICCILHTSVPLFPFPAIWMQGNACWLWKYHLDPYQHLCIPCARPQQSKQQTNHHTDTGDVSLASHSFEPFRISSSFNRVIEGLLCNTVWCILYLLWILHHLPLVYKATCYITCMNGALCTLQCCLSAWKFCTTLQKT